MKTRPLFLYILLCCISAFFCLPAGAFSISPTRILATVDPGDSEIVRLKIGNDSLSTKIFHLVVVGVKQGLQGEPVFKNGIDAAESWVKFNENNLIVPAQSGTEAVFEIKIPKQVYSGTHYLGLGVEEKNLAVGTVGVSGKIFSLVNLKVAGNAVESLQTKKFVALTTVGDWQCEADLVNVGNVEVPYKVKAEVYNWRSKKLSSQSILEKSVLIPQAQRVLQFTIKSDQFFWPGPRDVNLVVNYGLTNQTAVSTLRVWYWPVWSVVLLILIAVIIIVGIGYWKLRPKKYEL